MYRGSCRKSRIITSLIIVVFLVCVLVKVSLWETFTNSYSHQMVETSPVPATSLRTTYLYNELTFNQMFPLFDRKGKNNEIHPGTNFLGGNSGFTIYRGVPGLVGESKCVPLRLENKTTPICIYDREKDNIISSYISDYGVWEPELMEDLVYALKGDPELQFIDLGCNIGVFTLVAASLGRRVICVEPLLSNLQLLHKSLELGNMTGTVTMLLNALSDVREHVSMEIVSGNIGGSYVIPTTNKEAYTVNSILLDDILEIVKLKRVFIKMDIEGHEYRTLKKATKIFQDLDVKYFHMEWVVVKGNPEVHSLIETLVNRGFLPYSDIKKLHLLDPDKHFEWPDNLYWMKR